MSKTYDKDSIKKLSAIDHIKLRPGMYIGETDTPKHLFHEAFDNAIDECQNGYSDRVEVRVFSDRNMYVVRDYGRGIPFGTKEFDDGTKGDVLISLCTDAFCGGKFDDGYGGSFKSGLNGLGLKCINALSAEFTIVSHRDGQTAELICNRGKQEKYSIVPCHEGHKEGTQIKFIPDEYVFSNPKIPMNFIIDRCKIANAFGHIVELYVDGEPIDVSATTYDLLPELDDGVTSYFNHSFTVIDPESEEKLVITLEYTSDTSWYYRGYTNLLYNSLGGTHLRTFDNALVKAWRKYDLGDCLDKDLFIGLRAVVAGFLKQTSFSSQTKEKLTVEMAYLAKFVPLIKSKINEFLDENDTIREGLIKRFKEHRAYINKSASQKELQNLLYTNDNTKNIRRKTIAGTKLKDCTSNSREGTELIIVEGDSAMGGILQARNIKTQAVIPLRGKILNVAKLGDIADCMKNQEVRSIVNCIGAGLFDQCNPELSRYERIIIVADSDPDGYNIAALVLGMFMNVLPEIVKAGMVYIAKPALYGWWDKSLKRYMFCNDITEVPKGVEFTRYKGLGEYDPIELQQSMLDPEYRSLMQMTYPDDPGVVNSVLTSSKVKFSMLEEMGVIKYS